VRSSKDFEYEREQADINRQLTNGEVETILLYAEPQLSSISSSMVRELQHFGQDITPFLPRR
jgi:pantetheine-phosphate adenylyltransferase